MKFIKNLFRPVLSDIEIKKYIKKGLLFKTPIKDDSIQPNSVDLSIGYIAKEISSNSFDDKMEYIDCNKCMAYNRKRFLQDSNEKLYYILQPGEFVLLASKEILNIPNGIIAFVQGRSSIARIGIQTEQAGLIDSGFNGTITFEVYNETKYPIKIYEKMRIAQVYFFKSQYSEILYGDKRRFSKYQNQIDPTGSLINRDFTK